MAIVELATQPWGYIVDANGNPMPNTTVQIRTLAGANATTYSTIGGAGGSTADFATNSVGLLERFIDEGSYNVTVNGTTRQGEAPAGATLVTRNEDEPWYGDWATIGNTPGSVGFAGTPTAAPATTVGSGGVTLPLTNGTVPITDTAQLSANGGSFTLGGHVIVYSGRSTASGAGNATGAYTLSTASGTYASGTALGFTSIGYGPLAIYEKFGDSVGGTNRPVPGSTQAGFLLAAYYGPTVDDSAEAFSSFVGIKDTGTPFAQNRTAIALEGQAQVEGGNTMPGGDTAPLVGVGGRVNVVGATSHVKSASVFRATNNTSGGPPYGFVDLLRFFHQPTTGLVTYTTLNGAATLPQATIPVVSGAAMPPASASAPVTVLIGSNADGVGGQEVTYTGISTNNLTGCTGGTGTIATGSRVTNISRAADVKDLIASTAGVALGASGWSASVIAALRGGTDADLAMLALTGPTNAEVSGGLTLMRLNAGSGQTKPILKAYDTGGTNRFSIGSACQLTMNGASINLQQSGTGTGRWDPIGFMQPGVSSTAGGGGTAVGSKIYSGASGPPTTLVGTSGVGTVVGDLFIRTDGGVGTTLYRCTAVTGGSPPTTPATSVTWTAIL